MFFFKSSEMFKFSNDDIRQSIQTAQKSEEFVSGINQVTQIAKEASNHKFFFYLCVFMQIVVICIVLSIFKWNEISLAWRSLLFLVNIICVCLLLLNINLYFLFMFFFIFNILIEFYGLFCDSFQEILISHYETYNFLILYPVFIFMFLLLITVTFFIFIFSNKQKDEVVYYCFSFAFLNYNTLKIILHYFVKSPYVYVMISFVGLFLVLFIILALMKIFTPELMENDLTPV